MHALSVFRVDLDMPAGLSIDAGRSGFDPCRSWSGHALGNRGLGQSAVECRKGQMLKQRDGKVGCGVRMRD